MSLSHGVKVPLRGINLYWDSANLRSDNRQANAGGAGFDLVLSSRYIYWTGTNTWSSSNLGYRTSGGASIFIDSLPINSSTFSFCLWNLGGTGQSGYAFGSGNNMNISLALPLFTAGVGSSIIFRADNGNSDAIFKQPTAAELSGWTFWAGTKNTSTGEMKLYRNGVLWHSESSRTTTVNTNANGIRFFSDVGGSNVLASAMSIIAFYTSELSISEINQFYNNTKGRYGL